jgi:hypothetical protein
MSHPVRGKIDHATKAQMLQMAHHHQQQAEVYPPRAVLGVEQHPPATATLFCQAVSAVDEGRVKTAPRR